MKAHLGRHMATIHASPGARRAAAKKRKAGRKPGRPATKAVAVRSTGGNGVSGFLSDMQTYHANLTAQRDEIDGQITAIETAMSAMGGSSAPARRGPGRPKGSGGGSGTGRPGSLKDMIIKVLGQRKQPLSPNQISAAVLKAGYKSRAKDLTKAVSNVLPDIKKVKRIGFGSYTV